MTDASSPEQLIEAARAARERAYAPYSGYRVGAAISTPEGRIYTGCNVENASYGLTVCAERVALGTAVAAGERHFTALAVVTGNGAAPCGACRQVLHEFGADLTVHQADTHGHHTTTTIGALLPGAFDRSSLPTDPE